MFQEDPLRNFEDSISSPDEGWWDSLLADEEKNFSDCENPTRYPTQRNVIYKNNWDYLRNIYQKDSIIELEVVGYNRGGLLVQGEKTQGFVPISHLVNVQSSASEEEKRKVMVEYVGNNIQLKIIEFVPEEERVVFSERAAQAGEGKRKIIFSKIQPGDTVSVSVTNITNFGIFIDLGWLEGLIHLSELSWARVDHPGDILHLGQTINTLVLSVSEESGRIALSYKRLTRNPWESISDYYNSGDIVSAKITAVTKFGAFARLDEGVEGLIHISTIVFPDGRRDIHKIFKKDDCVSVKILHIDPEKKRIGLCLQDG